MSELVFGFLFRAYRNTGLSKELHKISSKYIRSAMGIVRINALLLANLTCSVGIRQPLIG